MDDGSIAKTATLFPLDIKNDPKASIIVDFPTPGTPVIPILIELLFSFSFDRRRFARNLSFSNSDSTKVIAFAKCALEPFLKLKSIESISSISE